jgi:hypothetical protein
MREWGPRRHDRFAPQHGWRSLAPALAGGRAAEFWRRATTVVVGIALLGAASTVREFDISIRDRRVEGGASTLRVMRGETVVLRWYADEAVSLHIHGYDLQVELAAATPQITRFDATVAGRFPIAAHEFGAAADTNARPKPHRELTLLYLEVLPE